jgi:hypothetical protein
MAQDWSVISKIWMHTLTNGSAILSFVLLTYITKHGIQEGVLRSILEGIEGIVLVVLVLIFALTVIYDVLPEKIRHVVSDNFVFA